MKANMFNCSSTKLRTLPHLVPNFTDWVVLKNNNLRHVDDYVSYLDRIRYLDLANNQIFSINDSFLSRLTNSKMLVWLNLAENQLRSIPEKFQELTKLEKLWLGRNPIHCDCPMAWMINWLNNFTTAFGQHIIVDYQDIKCHSGEMIGIPIFELKEVDLGCYPNIWTTQQRIIFGSGLGTTILIIVSLAVLLVKRSRDIKFFLYYYCKSCACFGVPRDDKKENLNDMEYDAYLSYRLAIFITQIWI